MNLCRFVDLQAEETLRKANRKFVKRFKRMEKELAKQGKNITEVSLATLDEIWDDVKRHES